MDEQQEAVPPWLMRAFYASAVLVALLYILAPAREVDGLPVQQTAWLLWTPAIPLLLAAAFFFLTLASLGWNLSAKVTVPASASLMLLATLGHQIGYLSPIGADGWFFTELARLHLQFGSATIIDGYLARPGVLLLLKPVWWLAPQHAPAAASIIGMLLSGYLFWLMCSALVREQSGDSRWLPVVSAGFAGAMLSGWNPAAYSAQLLALALWFWIVHHRIRADAEQDPWVWIAIGLLTITHMFTPLMLLLVLLFEGRFADSRGRSARWLAFGTYTIWMVWAIGPAGETTMLLLAAAGGPVSETAVPLLSIAGLFALLVHAFNHRGMGDSERDGRGGAASDGDASERDGREGAASDGDASERDGREGAASDGDALEPLGASASSVVLGVLAFLPVLLLQQNLLGAESFAPRTLIFLFVPVGTLLYELPAYTGFEQKVSTLARGRQVAVLVTVGLIVGSAMGVAHSLWVQRSLVMPEETADCWEAAQQAGVWGLVDSNGSRWGVLHSPQMRPPTVDEAARPWFDSLGESNDMMFERTGAVIETVDFTMRAEVQGLEMGWQSWSEVDGVDGACRVLVRPEAAAELTPGVWG